MNLPRSACLVPVCLVCFAATQEVPQTAPNLSALAGCWSAKVAKEAALVWTTELLGDKNNGECKVTAKEDWFVCLIQDSDGNLNGEMTNNHSQNGSGTNAPFCTGVLSMSLGSAVYRCRIAQKANATAELVFDRCQYGQCSTGDRRSSTVPITQEGAGWSIKFPNGKVVAFEKYKESGNPK